MKKVKQNVKSVAHISMRAMEEGIWVDLIVNPTQLNLVKFQTIVEDFGIKAVSFTNIVPTSTYSDVDPRASELSFLFEEASMAAKFTDMIEEDLK